MKLPKIDWNAIGVTAFCAGFIGLFAVIIASADPAELEKWGAEMALGDARERTRQALNAGKLGDALMGGIDMGVAADRLKKAEEALAAVRAVRGAA